MLSTNPFLENFPGHVSLFSNQEPIMNGFQYEGSSSSPSPSSGTSSSGDTTDSNPILRYISDILMDEEDDLENKPCMLQQCLKLQAAEKSFYEVLGNSSSYSPPSQGCDETNQDGGDYGRSTSFESYSSCTTDNNSYDSDWVNLVGEYESSLLQATLLDSPNDGSSSGINYQNMVPLNNKRSLQVDDETSYEEGQRGSKISAVFADESEPPEILDEVLRVQIGRTQECCGIERLPENEMPKKQNLDSVGSNGKTGGRSKKGSNSNSNPGAAVDLWTLLTQCAQAVANYDQRNAYDTLKQIRQHSSPSGDGLQRMAYYFAIGLETRLNAGTPSYLPLEMASAADMLKAYKLFVTVSPLQRMSNKMGTLTIMNLVQNGSCVHIIDFGICYGFQWPCLIRRLSERNGAIKLRITGIDLPQPGFRPAERLEETGRRLENFCKRHKVPFEYNCIAQKWETIRLEDLKIDRNEVTVVNCLYRLRNLPDETVSVNSPRDAVLKLIRRINPNIFIHGVVNGSYSAPFFLTRFREALFNFSSLFDMFEANAPREDAERMLLEKGLIGRDAINVIACEGAERVERPETYKQWQIRNKRAGFKQIRVDQELDGKWVLQGWKGRILNAFSVWVPA
ncbi:hypothetical protein PIB30_008248 [Stylosanthes scabra]|uniref:Uncharacterized protein n=1 Tax=Stylosanthes scabra TaxID=79078 RepID=A0ABU6R570_9FABA|nr:hypothetical protein [Stylosanthes scabra]